MIILLLSTKNVKLSEEDNRPFPEDVKEYGRKDVSCSGKDKGTTYSEKGCQ